MGQAAAHLSRNERAKAYRDLLAQGRELYPGMRIGRPGRSRMYWGMITLLRALRIGLKVDFAGAEHLTEGPAIIISNHVSGLDPIAVVMSRWWRITAFAKVEFFASRGAFFFRWMGQIPLRRGDAVSTEWAIKMSRLALAYGGMIGLYPEGTRSPDKRLHKLHKRVMIPLLQANAHVPVHALVMSYRPRRCRRTLVTARLSQRIPLDPEHETPQALTTRIRDVLLELGDQAYVDEYARDVKKRAHPAS